jgi:hypothetical protein
MTVETERLTSLATLVKDPSLCSFFYDKSGQAIGHFGIIMARR